MKAIAAAFWELVGLFVDDGALALAIAAVVVAAGLASALLPGQTWLGGAILLLGCLGVLFVNVMAARRR